MNHKAKADCRKLMWWVAKHHSILNTAWPKPGEPALAGASVFIGTTLFKSLENSLPLIEEEIDELSDDELKGELKPFLEAFKKLFFAVGRMDRNINSEQVDFAFNILYLASGIFYHRIEQLSFTRADLENEFIRVKPFGELLELCRWPEKSEEVKPIFDSLISQMSACAQDLKHDNRE
jgi:hypothetical protein